MSALAPMIRLVTVTRESLKGTKMRARLTARAMLMLVALLATMCVISRSQEASGPEIDASVNATLDRFFRDVWSSLELANKAFGVLVFPTVIKAGFGLGGEY